MHTLRPDAPMPLVVEPTMPELDIVDWILQNTGPLKDKLARHGAIVFRGLRSIADFERAAIGLIGELFSGSGELVRSHVTGTGQIYTPVEYPAELPILWHNENTFKHEWPLKIFFYCATPAEAGGNTPLVDSRLMYQRVPAAIRARFADRGIMYVRNFRAGLGLDWKRVFQVEDRPALEALLERSGTRFEWKGERLRTWTVRPAVMTHPRTRELVWINQATHWHVSYLPADVRASLLSMYAVEELPRHCFYGDGSTISDDEMADVKEAYRATEVSSPWHAGEAVLLDNLLVAHGREPYRGERRVYVAMGEMYVP
jgi:alpha-ketoglutarate-dependent taurine dioxygenase